MVRSTIGKNDKNFAFGVGTGGIIGGFASQEGDYFSKLSDWSQGLWEDLTGKTAREAGKEAAKEAERARRQAIIRQFGERQQADSMVMASMRSKGPSGGSKQKNTGGDSAGGFIGAGFNSTSGTF